MDLNRSQSSSTNALNSPNQDQADLYQQMAEMRKDLESYKSELQTLRQNLDSSKKQSHVTEKPTSRRRVLKRMMAGAAGLSVLSLASTTAFAAEDPNQTAIDASGNTGGFGGKFSSPYAQVRLVPAAGAVPSITGHEVGELFVDSNGVLYYSVNTAGGGTTANKWIRLAGPSTAGSLQLFSTPARFINTLDGTGVPGVAAGAYVGTKVFTIGGQTIAGKTVPSGASGILAVAAAYSAGFLSAVPFSQSGILTVFGSSTGSPTPSVNSVSFSAGQLLNSSQVISSLVSDKLAIFTYANGQPVNVVLDILGYYL